MIDRQYDLNDFVNQIKTPPALPLELMLNSMSAQQKQTLQQALDQMETPVAQQQRAQLVAIIESMSEEERANPDILTPERIQEIAEANNTDEKEINNLLNQFRMLRQIMSQVPPPPGTKLPEVFPEGQFKLKSASQNEEPDPDQ